MISAFGVEHGEISKGWLSGDVGDVKSAYRIGRIGRAVKTTTKQGKKLGLEELGPEEYKDSMRNAHEMKTRSGLAGRIGYHSPEIVAGATGAAGAGGGYAVGRKKKGSR